MGQRAEQAASPTSNALGWCVLARSSAVNHEGPHGEPQALVLGPRPEQQPTGLGEGAGIQHSAHKTLFY